MKKIITICVLLAACLGFQQEMKAQYVGRIERENANLVDQSGHILTDDEIIGLVGEDIYYDTVVGARRQLRGGKSLIIGGAAGMGTGLVLSVFAGVMLDKSGSYSSDDRRFVRRESAAAAGMYLSSLALSTMGFMALSGGVALRSIGKARLGWVADQCNPRTRDVTLEWTAVPGGAGIVMRF